MVPAPTRVREALEAFFRTSLDDALSSTASAEARMLALFRDAAARVPAYARTLASHGVDPARVRSMEDFRRLPLLTKQGYVKAHPLADLCWDGRIDGCDMIAVSSGSTGEPTFWPRFVTHELAVARRFEQVFADAFQADRRRTLTVVCFPLGTWVGGLYTAACCRHLAAKGFPIVVVAPGNNKTEILRVVGALGEGFEQRVLLGYPPFLKDVVDSARAAGFDWSEIPTKLVLAGEVVSEAWRTLLAERLGGVSPLLDFASLYGTADAGVLGNETPLSIAIRRFLADRPEAARGVFGESRLPTLVQYDPTSRWFEVVDGTLVVSGDNGAPLVRYHIADTGGVYEYDELLGRVRDLGFDEADALPAGAVVRRLPFVYVFGRADFTISHFGANVFPENVTVGLEQPEVREWVTGKFVLESREDAHGDKVLSLVVELAVGAVADEPKRDLVATIVQREVARLNSEFANYVPADRQKPVVELRRAGDPEYFPIGVKHRYTRREGTK